MGLRKEEKNMELKIKLLEDFSVTVCWEPEEGADCYRIYWADRDTPGMCYRLMAETQDTEYTLHRATHIPHYMKVAAVSAGEESKSSPVLRTPVKKQFHEQLEELGRGLVAIQTAGGIFLSWRMLLDEVSGYCGTGMTGTDYAVYRGTERIAVVTDSTNYLDRDGTAADRYRVVPVRDGKAEQPGGNAGGAAGESGDDSVGVWPHPYWDIPLQKPEGGVTPAGEAFEYHANDMSVGDVDGDGEYEFVVKWDPSNSHDVSQKGYTGKCYLDCYKLDGALLWRLDMGVNIRAGAHYTQFMVYDFNGDGKAEMAVKTAPGTKMTRYKGDGQILEEHFITMPEADILAGVSHESNFVCSANDYREHMADVFRHWQEHPEVVKGRWPETLEECFGIEKRYEYPLNRFDRLFYPYIRTLQK